MSVWLGTLGSMVETLCASQLPVSTGDRRQYGGGAGTLAPARSRVVTAYGAGAREWAFSRGAHEAHGSNAVASIARAQARGVLGPVRMVPCNAPHMNMLTPGASEEFAGWSGPLFPAGPQVATEPVYSTRRVYSSGTVLEPGTVMDDSLVLEGPGWETETVAADEAVFPASSVTLQSGQTAVSPVVPLLGRSSARFGVFLARESWGTVTVTLEGVDATGSVVDSTVVSASSSSLRRETWLWEDIDPAAVGVRFRITHNALNLTLAWPSITLGDRLPRWVPGQAAEQVVISTPAHDPFLLTPERSVTSTGYTAREEGV